jgi:hypothetical protein
VLVSFWEHAELRAARDAGTKPLLLLTQRGVRIEGAGNRPLQSRSMFMRSFTHQLRPRLDVHSSYCRQTAAGGRVRRRETTTRERTAVAVRNPSTSTDDAT